MQPVQPLETAEKAALLLHVELSTKVAEDDWQGTELSFRTLLGIQLSLWKLPAKQP